MSLAETGTEHGIIGSPQGDDPFDPSDTQPLPRITASPDPHVRAAQMLDSLLASYAIVEQQAVNGKPDYEAANEAVYMLYNQPGVHPALQPSRIGAVVLSPRSIPEPAMQREYAAVEVLDRDLEPRDLLHWSRLRPAHPEGWAAHDHWRAQTAYDFNLAIRARRASREDVITVPVTTPPPSPPADPFPDAPIGRASVRYDHRDHSAVMLGEMTEHQAHGQLALTWAAHHGEMHDAKLVVHEHDQALADLYKLTGVPQLDAILGEYADHLTFFLRTRALEQSGQLRQTTNNAHQGFHPLTGHITRYFIPVPEDRYHIIHEDRRLMVCNFAAMALPRWLRDHEYGRGLAHAISDALHTAGIGQLSGPEADELVLTTGRTLIDLHRAGYFDIQPEVVTTIDGRQVSVSPMHRPNVDIGVASLTQPHLVPAVETRHASRKAQSGVPQTSLPAQRTDSWWLHDLERQDYATSNVNELV